jgi:hypothetical protein
MPKIQWERLPKEKWTHLRDRAKERKIINDDLFELAEWKSQDPTCQTATGTRTSGPSNYAALAGFRARF